MAAWRVEAAARARKGLRAHGVPPKCTRRLGFGKRSIEKYCEFLTPTFGARRPLALEQVANAMQGGDGIHVVSIERRSGGTPVDQRRCGPLGR